MSRHNQRRKQLKQLLKQGRKLTDIGRLAISKHGKRLLAGMSLEDKDLLKPKESI